MHWLMQCFPVFPFIIFMFGMHFVSCALKVRCLRVKTCIFMRSQMRPALQKAATVSMMLPGLSPCRLIIKDLLDCIRGWAQVNALLGSAVVVISIFAPVCVYRLMYGFLFFQDWLCIFWQLGSNIHVVVLSLFQRDPGMDLSTQLRCVHASSLLEMH